jgi:hypothetical protein
MDVKQMLKDGFVKKQVVLLIDKDSYSGKEHIVVIDNMEHAKEYKTNENIRLATMYIKENCK